MATNIPEPNERFWYYQNHCRICDKDLTNVEDKQYAHTHNRLCIDCFFQDPADIKAQLLERITKNALKYP